MYSHEIRTGSRLAIETLHLDEGALLVLFARKSDKAIALGNARDRVNHNLGIATAEEGCNQAGWEVASQAEIRVAEDIHEVSVCNVCSDIPNKDAILDGIVDGSGFFADRRLGRRGAEPVDLDRTIRVGQEHWLGINRRLWSILINDQFRLVVRCKDEETIASIVRMPCGVGGSGRTRDVNSRCLPSEKRTNLNHVVVVHPGFEVAQPEGAIGRMVRIVDIGLELMRGTR
jgi:hypothetical protein